MDWQGRKPMLIPEKQKTGVSLNDAHYVINAGNVELKDLKKGAKILPPDINALPKKFNPEDRIALVYYQGQPRPDELINALNERTAIAQVDEQTLVSVARRCANNIIRNLPELANSVLATRIDNQPLKGAPGFIIGAGPSLDKNMHLLPECARHGIIFGVDAASGAIAAQGVESDIMVSLESKGVSHYLTHGHPGPYPNLCVDLTGSPENWAVPHERRLVMVNADPAYSEPIVRLGGLPLAFGGSVALTAWALAYYYGCDPIVLLGMDLAYTGGHTYAQNTKWAEQRIERIKKEMHGHQNDLIKFIGCEGRGRDKEVSVVDAPAWGGKGTVETSHEMLTYRAWYEEMVSRCNVCVVNATEGGCKINGTVEMKVEDVLAHTGSKIKASQARHMLDEGMWKAGTPSRKQVKDYMLDLQHRLKQIVRYVGEDRHATKWDSNYNTRDWIARTPIIETYLVQWAFDLKHSKKHREVKDSHNKQQIELMNGCTDMLIALDQILRQEEWR
jgi:hypothetical protein